MDGTDSATYAAIRGLDAFDKVCEGIRAAAAHGLAPGLRVTLQRANYRQLAGFVELAKQLGAAQVSFLAVDVANPHAFGRKDGFAAEAALDAEDLTVFDQLLLALEQSHCEDFRSGFIAESPAKLRRIGQYFAAVRGQGGYPPVRCNAPEFSAVIGATGKIQPCFFIPGPPDAQLGDNLRPRVEQPVVHETARRHTGRNAGGMQNLRVFPVAGSRRPARRSHAGKIRTMNRQSGGKRLKVVLYNPHAVFFTMPLALLAIGSELDPSRYEVVIIDARLDADAENTVLSHIGEALCLGVTVLTGAPISDALRVSRAAKRSEPTCRWSGADGTHRCFPSECLLEGSVDVDGARAGRGKHSPRSSTASHRPAAG